MAGALKVRLLMVIAISAMPLAFLANATHARAAGPRPEALIQFPGDKLPGASAGRTDVPQSLAASPLSGDIYVADDLNHRVDEFTAWGQFVRAFGWRVNAATPEEKLQVCTLATGCLQGSAGTGAGQFGSRVMGGIAVDVSGNVYVGDIENHRIEKFSATGEFLLAFGSAGSGDGQLSINEFGSYVGVSPDGATVYVGDQDRIQAFDASGNFKAEFTFKALHEESSAFPETATTKALAVDPTSGALYVALAEGSQSVFKLDPEASELQGALTAPTLKRPTAVAVDSEGNVYVINSPFFPAEGQKEILKFDAAGKKLIPDAEEEVGGARFGEPTDGSGLFGLTTDSACDSETDDLYVGQYLSSGGASALSYVSAYGPPPQNIAKCPPPPAETPEINAQYATAVGTDSAVLKAEINPHYALDTTYFVEYGTGKCSEAGCGATMPLPPGSNLTSKVSNASQKTAGVTISSLQSGATYHYRFVATSSGGGPVRGVGGKVGLDGAEGEFTTFPPAPAPLTSCANQAFRTGASARLANCRAYELVSPAQRTPAGDIVAGVNGLQYPAELNQSASDGEKLAYSSEYAFGSSVGAPIVSEYLATRVAGQGWSTDPISPKRESELINKSPNIKVDIEDKAFTADLCRSWLMHDTEPPLSAEATIGFPNIYRRENCGPGAGSYESITAADPVITTTANYWPELQGFSADGSHAVFRVAGKLTADAPDLGAAYKDPQRQLYAVSAGGQLRFVCRLPDGTAYVGGCSAGTPEATSGEGRKNSVAGALAADGQRLYWSAADSQAASLYLRENPTQEQSAMAAGKCTEADKACSYAVSSGVARFWAASSDGAKALYAEGGDLREFNAETKKSKLIAQEVLGVAGASKDLARFYFASSKRLGGEGVTGEPNLYLSDEGAISLVATLADGDLEVTNYLALNPIAAQPVAHGARVSDDGRQLLFASVAPLTGYDNHDSLDGRADDEVYLYRAKSSGPVCISCNPSGARPTARQIERRGVAALIPVAANQLYAARVMSADGNSVFFESFEALVARDTNGKGDVYEWRRAADQAACAAVGAEIFSPDSGGCLSLISSGQSPSDSSFVDSGASGRDVFFKTAASLLSQDQGLIDIYDAREGGGFAPPPTPQPPCLGQACQSSPPPPAVNPPASEAPGPGNVRQGAKPKACPKGRHRVKKSGKTRCAKNKKSAKKGKQGAGKRGTSR